MDSLIELAPSPAAQEAITDDGLITTRLIAAFDRTATVGQINGSLNRINARIVAMTRGMAAFSLIIDPVANVAEAEEFCTALTDSFGFIMAFPAYASPLGLPEPSSRESATDKADLPTGVSPDLAHLENSRIPAAWNVRGLVMGFGFPVIIPDQYVSTAPHPDLTYQTFAFSPIPLTTQIMRNGVYLGNHGFHVTGIIGADWDGDLNVGVHPVPSSLNLRSVPIDRISWLDKILEIGRNLPLSSPFVLNTSIGFAEVGFVKHSKAERIYLGIMWRQYAHAFRNRSIHATSAGNQGPGQHSSWASPFTVSASQDDLPSMLGTDPGTLTERARLELIWKQLKSAIPGIETKPGNVFVVGSSEASSGNRSSDSVVPEDVRMVGEDVSSLCFWADRDCSPPSQIMSGTSMASPQVAGLAAYMWTLDSSLSASTIYDAIQYAYDHSWKKGVVDGLALVLGMDKSMAEARIRKELLDVANGQGAEGSNNAFDHHDIEIFLAKFLYYETERAKPGGFKNDHSRYDLNGDGYTGGMSDASFDLDINQPPVTGTVTQDIIGSERTFDEASVNDLEILCYYAFSDLFTGDTGQRDALLQECVESVKLITEFPDIVFPDQPATLKVKAASVSSKIQLAPWAPKGYSVKTDTTWIEGLDLQLNPTGGQVAARSGKTDASGSFSTPATIDPSADQIEIKILANRNGARVAEATETGTNGSAEITIRSVNFNTVAGGQAYAADITDWPDPDSDGSEDFVSGSFSSASSGGVASGGNSASFTSGAALTATVTKAPGTTTPLVLTFQASSSGSALQHTVPDESSQVGASASSGNSAAIYFRIDRGKVQLNTVATLLGVEVDNNANVSVVIIPITGTRTTADGYTSVNVTETLENGVVYYILFGTRTVLSSSFGEDSSESGSASATVTFTFKSVK